MILYMSEYKWVMYKHMFFITDVEPHRHWMIDGRFHAWFVGLFVLLQLVPLWPTSDLTPPVPELVRSSILAAL